jgi:arachidonate 15-lipoxygenase
MVSNEGMRIKGFPSQFETIDELAQTIGQIIFITTAHHSTVHYPQYLFSGFTPSMPFAAYAPAPTNLEENIDLLKVLPLRQPAMKQAFTFYVTNFKLESLGQDNNFEEKVQPVIRQYQQKLAALTNQLNEASISRLYPYVYLNPQYIPNSVMV